MKLKKIKIKYIYVIMFLMFTLLFVYLLFFPRKAFDIKALYEPTSEKDLVNFGNNVTQEFYSEVEYLSRLDIYVSDTLNPVKISLKNENDEIIFEENYQNFIDVINVVIPTIENSFNKKYTLSITSEDDIIIDTQKKINNNYIVGYKDKSLVITTVGYKNNRSDLWYPLFVMALLFTVYSLVEVKNEKK